MVGYSKGPAQKTSAHLLDAIHGDFWGLAIEKLVKESSGVLAERW